MGGGAVHAQKLKSHGYRSLACLWFVITRVFALKTEKAFCSAMNDYPQLALPSSKFVWEARTRDEWQTEKLHHERSCPITTFAELLEVHGRPGDAENARKLDTWEAGSDKLGMLMDIAVELAV